MKERNRTIDAISGFFILEIIIQHILQNSGLYDGSFFEKYIIRYFPAFMPWFYFKAGLMYKQPLNFKEAIKSRAIKLLYPFIVWSIIPSVLVLPFFILDRNLSEYIREIGGSLYYAHGPFNTPLWFLPSLLLAYSIIYALKKNYIYSMMVCSVVISYIFSQIHITFPLGVNNLPLGILFFGFGIIVKDYKNTHKTLLLFIFLLNMCFLWLIPSQVNFHQNKLVYGNYFLYFVEIFIFLFFLYLTTLHNISIKGLTNIGQKSILLYVTHAPIIVITKKINDSFNLDLSSEYLAIIYTVGIILTTILIFKYNKKVTILFKLK